MVRHKNRYFVVEIRKDGAPLKLKGASLYHSIMNMVQKLHGDFGIAAITSGFTAKYCNERTRVAVIRCRHGPHTLVASSLPFLRVIENKPVEVNSLYTGATIKQCFKFIKRYQEKKFDEYCVGLQGEEKETLRKEIMNLDAIGTMI